MSGGALREILAKFGVEVDDKKLHGFMGKIEHTKEKLTELGEVLMGGLLGEGFKQFIENQIKIGDELHDTAEMLGMNTTELQKMQFAAEYAGASAEAMTTGLRFLNRHIGEALEGGGEAAKTFGELKIQMKGADGQVRPLSDIIGDLADKMKDAKSAGERTNIAMKLLGRGGAQLLPMMQEGKEGIQEAIKAFEELGGGMSEGFTKDAEKAEQSVVKLRFAMQILKSRIAHEMFPNVIAMNNKFAHWVAMFIKLTKRTNVLKTALIALLSGGSIAMIIKLARLFGFVDKGILGTIKSLLKFGPILLLIAGLYLIFDDLYTLMTGGKSVIGETIDKLFGVGATQTFIQDLKDTWDLLNEAWEYAGKDLLPGLAKAMTATVLTACYGLISAGKMLGHAFMFAWDAVGGKLSDADKNLAEMGKDADSFGSVLEKMNNWVGGGSFSAEMPSGGRVRQPVSMDRVTPKATVPIDTSRQATGMSRGGAGGDKPIVINNNISGVTNPRSAAKMAGDSTKKALGSAQLRNAYAAVRGG